MKTLQRYTIDINPMSEGPDGWRIIDRADGTCLADGFETMEEAEKYLAEHFPEDGFKTKEEAERYLEEEFKKIYETVRGDRVWELTQRGEQNENL